MLLSKTSRSSSGSSNKDVDRGLITENEFKEIFPEGYCCTTLFAKPKEYWAMNRGTKLGKIKKNVYARERFKTYVLNS